MTPEQRHQHRRTKAAVIAECVRRVADHFKVDPARLISERAHHGSALRDARGLLVFHLYDCGMSFDSIARVIRRSVDSARKLESAGAIRMMGEDRRLVAELPRVPTALEIHSAPVLEEEKP